VPGLLHNRAAAGKGAAVGHRLISALIFLNALGLAACVVLIAAALAREDVLAGQVAQGLLPSLRMFVAGAALPTVAWGILAFEFDRAHAKKKLLESAAIYVLLALSLAAFVVAGWRVPRTFISALQLG